MYMYLCTHHMYMYMYTHTFANIHIIYMYIHMATFVTTKGYLRTTCVQP